MDDRSGSALKQMEIRNEAHSVSPETDKALRALRDLRLEALHQEQVRVAKIGQRSKAEKVLNQRLLDEVKKTIPDLESHVGKIRSHYATTLEDALRMKPSKYADFMKPGDVERNPPVPARDGMFWWAFTDWFGDNRIDKLFLTDGLHFFGDIGYDGDDLIHPSVGAVGHFELQADRRPPSTSGSYASTPAIQLFGKISGFTGYWHWLWAADDKWCKCWLILRQTAFQLVPHDFGAPGLHSVEVPVVLASREERRTLIDEENNGNFVDSFLPGFTPMPALQFGLIDPSRSIWVEIEARFDIQLEGWSSISFSPERNPMGSVLFQHPQWTIQVL